MYEHRLIGRVEKVEELTPGTVLLTVGLWQEGRDGSRSRTGETKTLSTDPHWIRVHMVGTEFNVILSPRAESPYHKP